jgi:tRNA (guanine-N7-)-methyltransferase
MAHANEARRWKPGRAAFKAGRHPRKRYASASSPVGWADRLMSEQDARKAPPKPFTVEEGHRRVRSFVLRQGRFTPAQQRAFDELWPRFGLDYSGSVRDYDAVFGRKAKRVLEIGFGNGEALRFAAQHDTARDYIGIEVHAPGVGRLLNALAA